MATSAGLPARTTHTFSDLDTLLSDFQTLLTHPLPNSPLLQTRTKGFRLPAQILSIRSQYFKTLLSARWHISTTPISKPNISAPILQDALEYLVTGAVTLPACITAQPIAHCTQLAVTCDELLCGELERTIVRHMRIFLNPSLFPLFINVLHEQPTVPDSLQDSFATFVARTLPHLLHARVDARSLTCISLLAARGFIPGIHSSSHIHPLALSLSHYTNLSTLFTHRNLQAVKQLLLHASPHTFSAHLHKFFSPAHIRAFYHAHASKTLRTHNPHSTRLLFESVHPLAPGCEFPSVTHVSFPHTLKLSQRLIVHFDPRTHVPDGTDLAFYETEPGEGVMPVAFVVGNVPSGFCVEVGHDFWWGACGTGVGSHVWGWKFWVCVAEREIHALD